MQQCTTDSAHKAVVLLYLRILDLCCCFPLEAQIPNEPDRHSAEILAASPTKSDLTHLTHLTPEKLRCNHTMDFSLVGGWCFSHQVVLLDCRWSCGMKAHTLYLSLTHAPAAVYWWRCGGQMMINRFPLLLFWFLLFAPSSFYLLVFWPLPLLPPFSSHLSPAALAALLLCHWWCLWSSAVVWRKQRDEVRMESRMEVESLEGSM